MTTILVRETNTMQTSQGSATPLRRLRRAVPGLSLLGAVLAFAACSNVLDVQFPGRIPVEQLDSPTLAPVLADGVVGDLECAYNNYFSGSSAQSDEFEASNDNGTLANAGERNVTAENDDYVISGCEASSGSFGIQTTMHTARFQSEDVYNRLALWNDTQVAGRVGLQAKVRAYGAYAYTFLGETYCTVSIDGSAPAAPATALALAALRFADAITLANQAGTFPGKTDIINMSNVGLARVNLDLKNWPAAATFAALVPAGFELFAGRGIENDRRWNKMYYLFNQLGAFVVANSYRNLNDPRVPIVDLHKGAFNPDIDLWVTTKYTSLGDPVRLASYREAQLILAEAKAMQGDVGGAMTILNGRRGELGLTPLAAADQAAAVNQVIDERRKELAFEGGHRLNDLLRKNIPWKVTGTKNPFTGRPYGITTCWPTPTKELNGH